jgi:poly-gamma-glutamate synthesis protein (capsule biosynthesis protein)
MYLVEVDEDGPRRVEAIPLRLEYCHTRLADRDEAAWITRRFHHACAAFGTDVQVEDDRLVITWE